MRTRWTARMVAVGAAVALTAAACGSGEEGEEAEGTSAEGEASEDVYESPIAEFLGEDQFSDPAAAEQEFADQEQERQELIAACMQEQGFEYVAYVNQDMTTMMMGEGEDGLEWGSEEWTAKYGYGVTTQWFSQEAVGPDLVGYEMYESTEDEATEDPNSAVYEGLSESEQQAYDAALWGDMEDQPAIDESLTEEEIQEQFENWQPTGCSAEADEEVYGTGESNEFYTEYSDELQEMYESIEADPRIVEMEQQVSDCVSEKGVEYVSEQDYWEELEPVRMELSEGVIYPGAELSEEEMAAMSSEELDDLYSQPETVSDEVKQRLAELQEAEIELAVAVRECGGGYEQNEELFNDVRVEYEQQFLDDHAAELEDLQPAGE